MAHGMMVGFGCVYAGTKFWRFVGFGCVFGPAVHLIVTSLGGLQRFLRSSH
ncbi:hypothetical protein HanXRQr2_Chr04g0162251 [Helianthus annuus]|uniref:Transmembrane protein n=1 Tax=Helianthus annuus TaxID=4232 RepID=A0A9K3J6T9_HELAN|nr:hypothetical protein HanXRQr2_Chr04g0162251 [Helianthus annuus]KAJ0931010.1 hypothetical protein HanPSC8_Chr04g0156401 [Helianthus annuus]